MTPVLPLLRTNPGLLISTLLMAGGVLVCAVLGGLMVRAGASLRPILWFAGSFAMIVVPQFLGHLATALRESKAGGPPAVVVAHLAETPAESATNRPSSWDGAQAAFGPEADPQLSSDAYAFNLQEMKSPLIAAATHAGWNWQPTVWSGPTWLRWLTE